MGHSASSHQHLAEFYGIYERYLHESTLSRTEATAQMNEYLDNLKPYLNTAYPGIRLICPEASDVVHINQVYNTPSGRVNAVFTLTPGGFGAYPLLLAHPGIFVYESVDTVGTGQYLHHALKPMLPLIHTSVQRSESKSKNKEVKIQWDLTRPWLIPVELTINSGDTLLFYSDHPTSDLTVVSAKANWTPVYAPYNSELNAVIKPTVPSTYYFTCKAHPQMRAKIVVS